MRARTTIWTGLALAACATLSLVLWKLDKDGREEAIESAFRLTEARVAVADARVSGAMGEVSQVLRSVEDYLRIRSLPQSLDDDDHLFLASRAADQAITTEVVVVSADGAIIGHSDLSKPPVIDVSDRDYFQALSTLANSRDLYIGRPVTSRTSGATVIPVARALYTEAGIFAGVVAAAVDPDDLLQVLPPTGDTVGTAVLAREDGIVLAREPANEQYLGSDTSSAPLFTTHIPASPRGSYVSISPLDNHHRLISYRHDADLGTVTLVTADRYAVLAPQATMRAAYVGIGVVGSGLILLLFTMLYRQTTRRQRAVDALVESRAELARLNEQLEARVLERTMDLQHSEARSRAFLEAAHDAVIVIDQDDRILEFNPAATRVFGYTAAEVERLTFSDLVPVYDPDAPEDAQGRHADGTCFPAECWRGALEDGVEDDMAVYIIRDISRRKAAEAKLVELATRDGLTGALNRRAFMERAAERHTLARRYGRGFSVLMIDADHFKAVNDTHGHDAGDAVLKALVASIQAMLRETDIMGRMGGEEFAAALPETDAEGARVVAERVREAVAETRITHGAATLTFTVSIGVATCTGDCAETMDTLLKQADQALYAAKQAGRNRVVLADAAQAGASKDNGRIGIA